MKTSRSGMTLVEVLLAAMLLGLGMMTIFTALSRCMRLIQASRDIQKMQLAFDRGNLAHPMADIQSEDDIEKLVVDGDDDLGEDLKGYVFSRNFDVKEKPEDDNGFNDHLFTVRTTVSWGEGDDAREEIVELIWLPSVEEWLGK